MKVLFFILSLLLVANAEKAELLATCGNAKVQVINLSKGKIEKFQKDKMILTLSFNNRYEVFLGRKDKKITPTKLTVISSSKKSLIFQYVEPIPDGYVLYTYHMLNKILTVQKSYSLLGMSLMSNVILTCD